MDLLLKPSNLNGIIPIPASKSIAHRAYLCAALSAEKTSIVCDSNSEDINATRECLEKLQSADMASALCDASPLFPCSDLKDASSLDSDSTIYLNCRESGSTLRFLLPLACVLSPRLFRPICFTGADSLIKRPLSPLVEELRAHGAVISKPDRFPLTVSGKLTFGVYTLPGNISSQFISGLLMALPLLSGDSELHITGARESTSYIALTLDMLKKFQIHIEEMPYGYKIFGGQRFLSPKTLPIEADWSSAAFWLAAGAIGTTSPTLTKLNLSSLQGDRAVVRALEAFGCKLCMENDRISVKSPCSLHGTTLDASDIPDLVPILALVAAYAEGETTFSQINRLRIKESDRIASTQELLSRLGVRTVSAKDTLTVYGDLYQKKSDSPPKEGLFEKQASTSEPIVIRSFNDHRIAMTAAIAATVSDRPILLQQAEAVNKSYPEFFRHYNDASLSF